MAKKSKKMKDLDPKARGKNVKGGRTTIGTQVERIVSRTGRNVERIGQGLERGLNPR
ncbi:MAG TPA: hypothetical protein VFA34_14515 [Actinomycetota bacterium]|jgi:hypothetical protein|nr:hypothetical protein [Actinomycetota bacterium]